MKKKMLIAIVVVAVIAAVVYAFLNGFGFGKGNGVGNGNTKIIINQESIDDEENNIIIEEEKIETQEENENSNSTTECAVIKISVYGNEYLHESERITLDDFIIMIEEFEDVVVQIKDDNASLKAYNALIDRLEDVNIDYVEQ